jgi:hypothetical protein
LTACPAFSKFSGAGEGGQGWRGVGFGIWCVIGVLILAVLAVIDALVLPFVVGWLLLAIYTVRWRARLM